MDVFQVCRMKQKVTITAGLFIALGFLLWACAGSITDNKPPLAVRGMLDLSNWDFKKDGPVALAGQSEFYWEQHLGPNDFKRGPLSAPPHFIDVHGSWNAYKIDGKKLSGSGYATYRVTVLLKEATPLALKFLDMGTAFRVFINGVQILSVGQAGTTPETTRPRSFPQVVDWIPESKIAEIIFQVSNFDHDKGGAWEEIRLGTKAQIQRLRDRRLAFDLIMFGSILIIGLYHLTLFTIRKNEPALLYFGLFCLCIAVRSISTVERYIVDFFPQMAWSLLIRVEYLTFYSAVGIFTLFIYAIFPKDFHKLILKIIVTTSFAFSGLVLLAPVRIFTATLHIFELLTVLCLFYGFYALGRAVSRKRQGAVIILIGFAILFIAVINDILYINDIIKTGYFTSLGLFVFIFCQAFLIAFRYSRAFTTIDLQHQELVTSNKKYRAELAERKRVEREKEDLQEKLVRSQKMEAIGLLAGGVAHDLNNILSGVVSYPDLLLSDIAPNSSLRKPLQTIRDSGIRAAAVVQDLLTLARRGVMNFEVLNLNDLITDYLQAPEHHQIVLHHPGVDVETRLSPDLLNINGSTYHLKKVIMNLVLNAAEAQPGGGIIRISTTNRYVDRLYSGFEDIPEGTYVVFKIEDRGIGIDREDLDKIFEPFYTKKKIGRSGTGLGMAVVGGSVHDHHGFIDIMSSPENGTTLEIYLAVTTAEIAASQSRLPVASYLGNGESILIVDDVAEQRLIGSKILRSLNYNVVVADSGEAAMEYLKDHPVDLLILDMIMDPGIDGLETYQRAIQTHPQLKAIITSGFSQSDQVKEAQRLGAGRYLKKPYTLESIGLAVKDALAGQANRI